MVAADANADGRCPLMSTPYHPQTDRIYSTTLIKSKFSKLSSYYTFKYELFYHEIVIIHLIKIYDFTFRPR